MSNLIDRLNKVGQYSPASIGFGPASRSDRRADEILLIGQAAGTAILKEPGLLEAPVDAVLVIVDDWRDDPLDRLGAALDGSLWGARGGGIDRSQADSLKERGCDFVVFGAEGTAAAVLNDDELGKFIAIGTDLSGREARAIQALQIDGVLLDARNTLLPLTVRRLLDVQHPKQRIALPFLVATSSELGADELEAIRDAGIPALVLDLAAPEAIRRSSEAIAALPRRKPRSASRSRSAAVPQPPASTTLEAGHAAAPSLSAREKLEDGA